MSFSISLDCQISCKARKSRSVLQFFSGLSRAVLREQQAWRKSKPIHRQRVLSKGYCGRKERRKRPKKDFIEMSLKHPDCKVWPHQGEWLRRARCEDRVLLVPRWQAELTSGDKARQKLALWGSLAPAHETRLLLKGGFVQSTGRIGSIGKAPSNRSKQLHELGFT
jgi:hypothetical protein